MARVYGEALKESKDGAVQAHREMYSRTMAAWMEELAADQPWEAFYWAEFLSDFPGDPSASGKAKTLAATLATDARVKQAAEAEKDIHKFCLEHYNKFIDVKAGKAPDPARAVEAKKLAEKYPGLPHAELLEKLGNPS